MAIQSIFSPSQGSWASGVVSNVSMRLDFTPFREPNRAPRRKEKTEAVETLHAEIDMLEASISKLTEDFRHMILEVYFAFEDLRSPFC